MAYQESGGLASARPFVRNRFQGDIAKSRESRKRATEFLFLPFHGQDMR